MLSEATHRVNDAPPLTKPTLSEVRMATFTLFNASSELKTCSKCGFPAGKFRAKRNLCMKCHKEYHAEYYLKNKEKYKEISRRTHLRRKYKLTPVQYESLLTEQNYSCAICHTMAVEQKNGLLNIDHCHKTGIVRGLLCWPCNSSIGKFKEDPELLDRAAQYLRGKKK